VYHGRLRDWRNAAIEAFLFLYMLFGERVEIRIRKMPEQTAPDQITLPEHAGRKVFNDHCVGETVDNETGKSIALGMDQPVRIGRRVELQYIANDGDEGFEVVFERLSKESDCPSRTRTSFNGFFWRGLPCLSVTKGETSRSLSRCR